VGASYVLEDGEVCPECGRTDHTIVGSYLCGDYVPCGPTIRLTTNPLPDHDNPVGNDHTGHHCELLKGHAGVCLAPRAEKQCDDLYKSVRGLLS
jgi:hypothetical protein